MFVFIWGSTRVVVPIGSAGERVCRACQISSMFQHVLQYDYDHLYHTFGFVTRRRFRAVCERCGNSWVVPDSEIPNAKAISKSLIPFLHRCGFLLFLVIAGIALITGGYLLITGAEERHQQEKNLRNAPIVRPAAPSKSTEIKGEK